MESSKLLEAAELLKLRNALHLIISSPIIIIGGKETQAVRFDEGAKDKTERYAAEKIKTTLWKYLLPIEAKLQKLGVVLEGEPNVKPD